MGGKKLLREGREETEVLDLFGEVGVFRRVGGWALVVLVENGVFVVFGHCRIAGVLEREI